MSVWAVTGGRMTEWPPDFGAQMAAIQDSYRAEWAPHRGRHRFRLLPNAPHPVTGLPTFVGCTKCGKPES